MASNSGKKSVLFEKHAAAVEPHLRTLKDWVQLGKESLVLISNSYNMHVKGLTMTQLAQALFDKFRREANPFSSVDDETSPTSFLDQSHASFHSGEDGPSSHVGQENRKRGVATVEESDVHQDDPQEPKRTRVDADFSNFSHDMKVFLRKELQNLVSTQNFVSPQGQGQLPRPSPLFDFSAAGSLLPHTIHNGGSSDVDFQQANVVRSEALQHDATVLDPISSVCLPPIPKRFLDKIKSREYVNFDALLPPSPHSSVLCTSLPMDDLGEFDLNIQNVDGAPKVSLSQKMAGKGKVQDFNSWVSAWTTYMRCMVWFYPHLVQQMLAYQTFISQFASQYAFASVYTYDQLHRLQLANNHSHRWDVVDDALFNMHLRGAPSVLSQKVSPVGPPRCFSCNGPGHFASHCPNRFGSQSSPPQFRNAPPRAWPSTHGNPCIRFNRGLPCRYPCTFVHRCQNCSKEHPATQCPSRPSKFGSR